MSLSPWDLGGNISFDFTIYRPRRPSYVFATQMTRQRSESYRHATTAVDDAGTRTDAEAVVAAAVDNIRKKRKDSYRAATQTEEEEEGEDPAGGLAMEAGCAATTKSPVVTMRNNVGAAASGSPPPAAPREALLICTRVSTEAWKGAVDNNIKDATATTSSRKSSLQGLPPAGRSPETVIARDRGLVEVTGPHPRRPGRSTMSRCRYTKNLIILSLSFILVFSAFRSIQSIQSSLNSTGRLGVIAMGCVHGTTFLTCLFTPVLINKLTSKWTIVLGLLFYLFWIAANFRPHLFTLVPTSIGVGFGQSLSWGAQVTYIQKLVEDYVHASGKTTQAELYRFNGIFLACFQTSHIWGNLVSSLMLSADGGMQRLVERKAELGNYCGVYDSCEEPVIHVWNTSHVPGESVSTYNSVCVTMWWSSG